MGLDGSCVGRHESTANRWVNHCKDNTQAVSFLLATAGAGKRERTVMSVITTARCLASAGHSRSPPHRRPQQTSASALEFAAPYQGLLRTGGSLRLIVSEERGSAEPRGSCAALPFHGGKHKDGVEQKAGRNEGLLGRQRGGGAGYESRLCWECQRHLNTHLTAAGDICPVSSCPRFLLPNNMQRFKIFLREESASVVNHAG